MTRWLHSNGGPFLLLAADLILAWNGTDSADYERACAIQDSVALLSVGSGQALFIGEPLPLTWVIANDFVGGYLVGWVYAPSDAAADAHLAQVPLVPLRDTPLVLGHGGGTLLLFEAADAGADPVLNRVAIELPAGEYQIGTGSMRPDSETAFEVCRLQRVSPPSN